MPSVLIIDDDPVLADLIYEVLTDEGYQVAVLNLLTPDPIRIAVGQLEPDCILLDSSDQAEYGESWLTADWLHRRGRPIPTIMFTAHLGETQEAQQGTSARSHAAHFAAILPKPFELDALLAAVTQAMGQAVPFDRSAPAEYARTATLVARLEAAGAQDIRPSARREWVSFRTADGTLVQLYWWQRDGVYYVLRYAATGGAAERVGRFYDLETAIMLAMTVSGEPSGGN